MSKFNIYSSSAGSGKTFTLTREYLRIILENHYNPKTERIEFQPYYFRQVLAITFTNDAANEMKERILKYLKEITQKEIFEIDESTNAGKIFLQIANETNLSLRELKERYDAVFKHIIQEYSDFSVKTIDSFVNQLVAAFTEDLGLPFNYEIVLDKDSVLLEAVERLIEKAGQEEYRDISSILEDFALSKAEEGKSWNMLPEELAKFGDNLLNDQYYTAISKLDGVEPSDFRKIRENIFKFLKWVENEVMNLAEKAIQIIENNGLVVDDFTRKASGIGAYFYRMKNDFDERFTDEKTPNSYHFDAVNNDNWYTKTTPLPIRNTIDSIKNELSEIFFQIQEIKETHLAKYLLFEQIKPHFYKLSLLSKIKKEFDAILDEKNQVFISEFNRKILQIVLNEPVPYIYERIGEKYNHILIDEFQDTSEMQFFNLLPLIENSLAKNNFNLIVGDAKQSIYRWRGGKMELIVFLFKKEPNLLINNQLTGSVQQEQLTILNNFINPVSLNTNFRSTKEIIEFNNDFFQIIQQNNPTYPFLRKVYDDTFQQKLPENPQTGGHIQIEFLEKDDDDLLMLQNVENHIIRTLNQGYLLKDIAILCRSNKNSAAIANYLTEKGFAIISRDSLLLKNSGSVRLLISNMKVLNNIDNKLARYEAAYLYYQVIKKQVPDSEINKKISESIESEKSRNLLQKRSTVNGGLYELTENLIQEFKLFDHAQDKEYLFRFLDIVLDFSLRQSNHLQDFLKYWEEKKNSLSVKSSGEQDAITITTIHRSKGLEYPVVIIPFANWDYEPYRSSTFWGDLENIDYQELSYQKDDRNIKLNASPFTYKNSLQQTLVGDQYAQEMQSSFMENLNMLYVAFTRPIDNLYVISQKDKRNKIVGIGKFLQNYLETKSLWNDEQSSYILQEGTENQKKTENIGHHETMVLTKIISENRSDRLRLRRISEKVFDPETLDKSKDKGNKIHAAFAKILSKNDVKIAVRELEYEGIISQNESKEIKLAIENIIEHPILKPLFEDGLQVENEREILTPNGEIQRPDRVVFKENEVFIIDYKTGFARENHERQIKNYGKLYKEMGFENIRLYLVYLEKNEVVEVN